MQTKVKIGTVIKDTSNVRDHVQALANELSKIAVSPTHKKLASEARIAVALGATSDEFYILWDKLATVLNRIAPPYIRFGTRGRFGPEARDYGFWLNEGAILCDRDDGLLVIVQSLDELDDMDINNTPLNVLVCDGETQTYGYYNYLTDEFLVIWSDA